MGLALKEFRIQKLHGSRSFRIPFTENRVILAGINGLGKTTVMTILYYLLSRPGSAQGLCRSPTTRSVPRTWLLP
jgi:hypothetical protein